MHSNSIKTGLTHWSFNLADLNTCILLVCKLERYNSAEEETMFPSPTSEDGPLSVLIEAEKT